MGLRKKIAEAIPENLRIAGSVGIGLFIAFLGFHNMGILKMDLQGFPKREGFTADRNSCCYRDLYDCGILRYAEGLVQCSSIDCSAIRPIAANALYHLHYYSSSINLYVCSDVR